MRNNKYNIEDLVIYARKYGVKSAAIAFSVGKSTIYRHISHFNTIEENSSFPVTLNKRDVLLDFRFQLLSPERIHRRKIIPRVVLLTAKDLNSNQFYFAICSDSNNSLVSFFSDYLFYNLKKANNDNAIDFVKHSSKSWYSLDCAKVDNSAVWTVPLDLLSAIEHYECNKTDYPEIDLLEVIAGEQFFSGCSSVLPVQIKDKLITEYKSYIEPSLYWKNKVNSDALVVEACNYLAIKSEKLIKQGETAKAIAVGEKALSVIKSLRLNSFQLETRILLILAKANDFHNNHKIVQEYYDKAMLLSPNDGRVYYQAAVYYLSINTKEKSREMLDRALDCYSMNDNAFAQCRYYEILGKRNSQYEGNFRNALVNFRKMRNIAQQCQNNDLLFEANGYLGNCYFKNRSYDLAEEQYLKTLEIANTLQDLVKLSTASYNLSLLYKDVNKFDKAELYIKQALIWARKAQDYYKIRTCMLENANILRINKNHSAALRNYQLLLTDYCKDSDCDPILVRAYNQIANLYVDMKQYRNACKYFKLTLKFVKKDKSSKLQPYILNQLAKISLLQNNESEAIRHLKKGFTLTKCGNYSLDIRTALLVNLGKIYYNKNNFHHACYFLTAAQDLFKQMQSHSGAYYQESLFDEVNEMINKIKK